MTLQDEQIEREKLAVTRGIERMREALDKDRESGRPAENPVGQAMVRRLVQRSHDTVNELQRVAKKKYRQGQVTGTRLGGWEGPITALDVDAMAFIAIKTMCNSMGRDIRLQRLHREVGTLCNLQVRWEQARKDEAKRVREGETSPFYNRIQVMKREVRAINPKSVSKWLKKIDDIAQDKWPQKVRVQVGAHLVNAITEACPDIFEEKTTVEINGRRRSEKAVLHYTDHAKENLDRKLIGMGTNSPWMMPMVFPPKPWTPTELGGYLRLPVELVKAIEETLVCDQEVPQVVYDALNTVQATAWTINERVFEVLREALEAKDSDVLPVAPVEELPEEYPAEVWAEMSAAERGKAKARRKEVHNRNFREESRRQVMYRQLAVAQDHLGRTIYFPHCLDFRGRVYPLPQDLHPQADDLGKALLTFAEAKPLGQRGFEWLQFHVANCYGNEMDKATRDAQLDWCSENIEAIRAVSRDPRGAGREFWIEADEPWLFLAACAELDAALEHGGDDYLCALPVSVDGSCNGLQHLSAMGKDPVGATAVNLMPGPRQDIYQIVADKVDARVNLDAAHLDDTACNWRGKVTRKVVKRGVMTKPYGLTHVGMKEQLLNERRRTWPTVEGDSIDNATYIRDRMVEAISGTVEAATKIMDWMQDCASIMADAGLGLRWTAPSGFQVHQFYPMMGSRRYTVVGVAIKSDTRRFYLSHVEPGILKTKQVQAVAPNIVHSFDAAHMQLAIVRSDVSAVSAVHDSFGCHACDMDGFLEVIKLSFMDMYEVDVLQELYQEFVAQAPDGVEIPRPPVLGDFEIAEVAKSDFFFA